jgi:hypothetical protein
MNQTTMGKVLALIRQGVRKAASHPREAFLSARMAIWIVLISGLAKVTSLPRTQKIAAFRIRSISPPKNFEAATRLGRLIDSLLGMDLFVFRRSCWKRALVLHRFLSLNGIESQIRFGLRKSTGRVEGHAWLEHEGRPLLEDNAGEYVVTFSLPADSAAAQTGLYPPVFSATGEEGIAK